MPDDHKQPSTNNRWNFFRKKEKSSTVQPTVADNSGRLWKITGKIFLWIFGVIFALILLMLLFLDQVLYLAVTGGGTLFTGATITLDEIELSLSRGDFKLVNLQISNPEGFENRKMLELGSFYIAVDKSSLLTDDIVIKKINLHKLHVTADVNRSGKLNFLKVVDNLTGETSSTPTGSLIFIPGASGVFPGISVLSNTIAVPQPTPGASAPRVWIQDFCIDDIRFNWKDSREKLNINGFGAGIQKISGSLCSGNVNIDNVEVCNPESFDKKHLVTVKNITVELKPETIYTPSPVISLVQITSMDSCAEFNTSGDFNVLSLVDGLQSALQPDLPEDTAEKQVSEEPVSASAVSGSVPEESQNKNTPAESDSEDAATENGPVLEHFVLTSSSFTIYNDLMKLPVTIPLALKKSNESFSFNDVEIFVWLREQAVALRDVCMSVTDAKDLVLKMVDSSAQAGVQLLDSTAKGGMKLINNTTQAGAELLDKTAKGGLEIIDKTGKSGKKTLNKIVDVFK